MGATLPMLSALPGALSYIVAFKPSGPVSVKACFFQVSLLVCFSQLSLVACC